MRSNGTCALTKRPNQKSETASLGNRFRLEAPPAKTLTPATGPDGDVASRGLLSSFRTPAPFVQKIFSLLQDKQNSTACQWSENGKSFTIWNTASFCRDVLPRYFRHNNLSSFIRQLNQYGFHKLHPNRWEFGHEKFIRSQPEQLKFIERKSCRVAKTDNVEAHESVIRSESPRKSLVSRDEAEESRSATAPDLDNYDSSCQAMQR